MRNIFIRQETYNNLLFGYISGTMPLYIILKIYYLILLQTFVIFWIKIIVYL